MGKSTKHPPPEQEVVQRRTSLRLKAQTKSCPTVLPQAKIVKARPKGKAKKEEVPAKPKEECPAENGDKDELATGDGAEGVDEKDDEKQEEAE